MVVVVGGIRSFSGRQQVVVDDTVTAHRESVGSGGDGSDGEAGVVNAGDGADVSLQQKVVVVGTVTKGSQRWHSQRS